LSPEEHRLPPPDVLLRIATGALLAAIVVCGAGHHAFGWDLESWLPWLPACAFRSATGIPCPGCGMTQAFLLLSELRVREALSANPASPALVAAMAIWLVRPLRCSPRTRRIACAAALAALLLGWGVRLSPLELRLPL
jgi:hypothetical protein